jgi:PAS domain S-box-containing protein
MPFPRSHYGELFMEYTLKELLDVPKLQELLDLLDEFHILPSAIIDMEGNVLASTAWQEICTKFHRVNPETEKMCIESNKSIHDRLSENLPHLSYRCPLGLVYSAIPIVIEGKHFGGVYSGQLFFEPPDESFFREQAFRYGFDEENYLAALRKVPLFSEEQLHKNLAFIAKLAKMLAEMGLQSIRKNLTEEAIRESNEKYHQLFHNQPAGFALHEIILDAAGKPFDYRFLEINPAFEKLTGLKAADITGKRQSEVIPNSEPYWAEIYGQVAITGKPVSFENYSVVLNKHYQVNAYSPEPGKFITVFLDISDLKQAEEKRLKLETLLLQSQKMESIGRLAGGVAHDFNNMLTVIIGHAQLALMRLDPAHPVCADLREISRSAERSADLTRQLLAFARKQTVAPKVINLNEAVASMLNILQRLIGEDISLTWKPSPSLWKVKVDPTQIDQIMANLCVNARDAISNSGRITIETANCSTNVDYYTSCIGDVPMEYVLLSVSDNGAGIDKETLSHIFEPFYTTKDQGKGTGLGLAIVYGIVRQNSGYIDVSSEEGTGTTFTIYLPRYKGNVANSAKGGASLSSVSGNETILLVEDEPSILNMVRQFIEQLGYKVLAAGAPAEAVMYAREYDGDIHLLMTDVVMPEMNGRELANKIRTIYPEIKHLFMSGYTAEVIAHHGVLDAGVNFIQKPFEMHTLALKLREVLDKN